MNDFINPILHGPQRHSCMACHRGRLACKGRGHLSFGTASISLFLSVSWITYGLLHDEYILVVANGVIMAMMALIVVMQCIKGTSRIEGKVIVIDEVIHEETKDVEMGENTKDEKKSNDKGHQRLPSEWRCESCRTRPRSMPQASEPAEFEEMLPDDAGQSSG